MSKGGRTREDNGTCGMKAEGRLLKKAEEPDTVNETTEGTRDLLDWLTRDGLEGQRNYI